MAIKKLSKSEIKKGKCNYPDPPDEGLPIWMGTFADMMTLLFAFFVLLFSMSTLDPVKYSAFQNANADKRILNEISKMSQNKAKIRKIVNKGQDVFYYLTGWRYCGNIEREHNSNNIIIVRNRKR